MCDIIQIVTQIWHHSLAARTPASHAGDRSSILRGATNIRKGREFPSFSYVNATIESARQAKRASALVQALRRTTSQTVKNERKMSVVKLN